LKLRRCGIAVVNLTADIQTILRAGSAGHAMLQQGDRVDGSHPPANRAGRMESRFCSDTSSRSIEEVAQLIVNRLRNMNAFEWP
jgi:hypothetical protein